MDEWDYIINQRPTDKRGPAVVAGTNGFVLLPDEWSAPSGISFDPAAAKPEDNTFSAEEWQKLEDNGAVFLPCAGIRSDKESNTTVSHPNKVGIYWSNTPETEDPSKENYAQSVYIMGQYIMDNINPYSNGLSVRLVREKEDETGIFDVQGDKAQSKKVLRGGQLLIERGGKTYNVQGSEVRGCRQKR